MSSIKLKVCGVVSLDETKQLITAGVDYVGLNFIPSSSRCISIETAESIAAEIKANNIKIVALFSDQPIELVNNYALRLNADYVQLHGQEEIEYANQIDKPIFRAIPVNPNEGYKNVVDYIAKYPAEYFVLDRHHQGSGDTVDTNIASQIISNFPTKIFLAGGLTPTNIEDTLAKVHPYGIDISSGVRTDGVLDIAKVVECQRVIRKNLSN